MTGYSSVRNFYHRFFASLKTACSNLSSSFKLSFFLPLKQSQFKFSWGAVLGFVLIAVLFQGTKNYFFIEAPRIFSSYGMQTATSAFAINCFAAFIICKLIRDETKFGPLVLTIYGGLLVPTIAFVALYASAPKFFDKKDLYTTVSILWWSWAFFIAHRIVTLQSRRFPIRRALGALIILVAVYMTFHSADYSFWYHDFSKDRQGPAARTLLDGVTPDELLQKQHTLLDSRLKMLRFEGGTRPKIYAVLFGSDGLQDLFMRETQFVGEVLLKSFDLKGRMLEMINNPKTFDAYPLATAANLEDTLQYMGKRMQPDDVLLLYLTSHGGKTSGLYVALGDGYDLRQLTGDKLSQFFKESGIKNRVIIESACYSGQIIDSLKNPHTVIMTSADKDHTSFGCSDKDDLTYFADAFFEQSLPKADNLIAAFAPAKKLIEAREIKEGITDHSNPQIYVGDDIKAVVERFEVKPNQSAPSP